MKLVCRDKTISLESAVVMGVLNVTPDSFSDGGLWIDRDEAVRHALDMVAHGAGIVDVGGESTRPDATPVSEQEELDRVLPVIEALAGQTDVPLSIDTRKEPVARAALDAGADVINETLGEEADGALDGLAARTGAGIVVMHSRGTPATMRSLTDYSDVVADVAAFLETRRDGLLAAGVSRDSIALDPGFGFAKTPVQNLDLLRRLEELVALGPPLVVGTSRKSFIGKTLGLDLHERLEPTIATMTWAVTKGASILRVHDVAPVVRAVRMTEAILRPPDDAREG